MRDVFIKCFETRFSQEMYSVSRSCWFWNFLSKESIFKTIQECKCIDHKRYVFMIVFVQMTACYIGQAISYFYLSIIIPYFQHVVFFVFSFFDKRSVIAQEKNLVLQIFLFYFPQVVLQFVLIQTWHWGNLCHYFLLMYLCLCRYLIILSILILCSKFH